MVKKTKIVCTIGPASEEVETLVRLIEEGMNVARLNFSHGNHAEHEKRIKNIRRAVEQTGRTVAILLDTKGPEIRTGTLEKEEIMLEKGQKFILTTEHVPGTKEKVSVTYPGLVDDVHQGARILLDDGLIELEVERVDGREIVTTVRNGGILKSKKGINVPNVSVNLPGMTAKDADDILFGIEQGIDFIAASFVRRAQDVLDIRELLEKHEAEHIGIIPKIENREGVANIDEILNVSDGLMVARGDLGVEIPAEEVPLVQKQLIKKCNALGKPVITATQMLDSMQRNPRPTRAEASDVANAIFDGTDCVMLSGETAAGDYPVDAVQTMRKIACRAETALRYEDLLLSRSRESRTTITDAISQSVAHTAFNLDVAAIITATESGHTARMIAKYRPKAPIVAVTPSESVCRQLSLVWGVQPVLGRTATSTDEMLDIAVETSLAAHLVQHGDLVVITAGVPVGESGTTNLMKVHVVGNIIAKGQGIGRVSATGKVVCAKTAREAIEKVSEGDILVTISTDRDMMPAIEKASALIVEKGGLTSHAAIVGLNLGIPVVVGVDQALEKLKDTKEATVDAERGYIYDGKASVL